MRVLDKVLVQGVFLSYEQHGAFIAVPSHPAAALLKGHDRARIAHQNA